MKHQRILIAVLVLTTILLHTTVIFAQEKSIKYKNEVTIRYYTSSEEQDDYSKERCVLDVYYPEGLTGYSTIVWFHGGSLKEGEKFIPEEFKNKGIAIVAVNYRLNPRAKCPAYIEDAAAAVAWTFNNIERYGGDKRKIFISGHSAGGYLTLMVGLDSKWLGNYSIGTKQIAGLFPISGQAITHTTIREERSLEKSHRLADEYSPLYYTRDDAAPLYLITGDRKLEIAARYEENALLDAYMRSMKESSSHLYELQGFDHITVVGPACYLILEQINKLTKQ